MSYEDFEVKAMRIYGDIPNDSDVMNISARDLTPKEIVEFDTVPESWRAPNVIPEEDRPKFSGQGYIHSPYADVINTRWGVMPIADLNEYRTIYRNTPIIKKAIDTQVQLAYQKGYRIEAPEDAPRKEEAEETVKKAMAPIKDEFDQVIIPQTMEDMMVYGYSDTEIIWDGVENETDIEIGKNERDRFGVQESIIREFDVEPGTAIVNMRALDPIFMRCRTDAFGNTFGYLQNMTAPPIAFTPKKILHMQWNPSTVPRERLYGRSELMALIRIEKLITYLENNFAKSSHAVVRPPVVFEALDAEHPLTAHDVKRIQALQKNRTPGADLIAFGCNIKPQAEVSAALKALVEFYDRLKDERIVAIGVPKNLLGLSEDSGHTTAAVNQDGFIVKIQGFQQRYARYIEQQIFVPAMKRAGWTIKDIRENMPRMKFEEISLSDINARSNRAINEFKSGLISQNEGRGSIGRPSADHIEEDDAFIYDLITPAQGNPITVQQNTPEKRDDIREQRASAIVPLGVDDLANKGLIRPDTTKIVICPKCHKKVDTKDDKCPECGETIAAKEEEY